MKHSNFLETTARAFLVILALTTCQAWAATPLNTPKGLALDAKGNLYVANFGSSQVLVYNPNFVQQTKKTIQAGVSSPTGVALDSKGNLYVANAGPWNVTVYDSKGKQNTGRTITSNVKFPTGIGVDGFDDVWVNNDFANVTMYSPFGTQIGTSTPGKTVDSIAVHGAWFVLGSDTEWDQYAAGEVLTNKVSGGFAYGSHDRAEATTFDGKGNYWVCQATGEVDLINPAVGGAAVVFFVSYGPAGIAVDSVRGRVFLASDDFNKIDVYSTEGALLTTLR